MNTYPLYTDGYKLAEDEYLLKIRPFDRSYGDNNPTGFMTKFNKNGSIPAAFDDWGHRTYLQEDRLPILIIKETFKEGWKLISWRIGESRSWAVLLHPDGFLIEIYLESLLDIIKNNTLVNGSIQGVFKWEYSKLIKQ